MSGIPSPGAYRLLSSSSPHSLVPGSLGMYGPCIRPSYRPGRACALGWTHPSLEQDALLDSTA